MWHDLASSLESTTQLVMLGFVLMASQHPLAMAGTVLLFVVLAVMLVAETIEERRAESASGKAMPIRIKRS